MDKRTRVNLLYLVFALLGALLLQSSGAADDLAKVANIARSMVLRYGMVESLGQIAYEEERAAFLPELVQKKRDYSEETAREIDVAVRAIVKSCYDKACAILAREKPLLDRGAQLLLQRETLVEAELAELRRGLGLEKAA